MKRKITVAFMILVLCMLLILSQPILAQTSTSYDLEWHVIGGGGAPITSSSYAINSTVGQPATSPPFSTNASYSLSGGFWFPSFFQSYIPMIQK